MIAIGIAAGGRPMANEIFKAPAGFLVGTSEGAQVLLGGLAVQFKLRAGQTAGPLSITEMTLDRIALVPPHIHADEDEYTYVAAGTIGVRVADEEFEAARGCYLASLVVSLTRSGIPPTSWRNRALLPPRVEPAGGGLQLLGVSARRTAPPCRWAARTGGGSARGKRPATRGNQWLRTTFGLKHHQVRPTRHRRPAWLRPLTGR
jgi:hypothetical protein